MPQVCAHKTKREKVTGASKGHENWGGEQLGPKERRAELDGGYRGLKGL